jgi:hypothetical protein
LGGAGICESARAVELSLEATAVAHERGPQGLKRVLILGLYAALKRRSSTVLHAFVSFFAASDSRGFRNLLTRWS